MSLTLYSAAQTREFDRIAIEEAGVPGFELMQRAGRAAFAVLIDRWPSLQRLSVCCGKGNNAGDGYLIGGLAGEYQFRRVQVSGQERYHDQPDKGPTSHIVEALHYGLMGAGETDNLFDSSWQAFADEISGLESDHHLYE